MSDRKAGARWRVVWTIFVKEVREIIRDRKTLFLLLAVPLIFYPLLLIMVTEVTVAQQERLSNAEATVAVGGEGATPEAFREALEGDAVRLEPVADQAAAKEALEAGDVQAVVWFKEGVEGVEDGTGTAQVELSYNSVEPLSGATTERLDEALKAWQEEVQAARLEKLELPPTFVEPVAVARSDVAPPARQAGSVLALILPMLVLVFMITGAFYPAIDLTAGERERKTMQTLLTAPIRPLEIVAGKYLTVLLVALASGLINIISLGLVAGHSLTLASDGGGSSMFDGVSVSAVDVGALIVVVVLMGVMFAAIMMTIAAFADTPKNAQAYLSPVYMLCLVPVVIAQIPGIEMSETTAFVPVLNQALLMKEILVSGTDWEHLFLVGLSSALTTLVALVVAARIFSRTAMLVQKATVRGFFSRTRDAKTRRTSATPAPDEALGWVALLFLVLYYVGSLVQGWDLMLGLVITLVGLILLPTVGLAVFMKLDLRRTFHLRRARWPVLLGAVLLGLSSLVWLQALTTLFHDTFLPIPEPFIEAMEQAFQMPTDPLGRIGAVAVMALAPAICEEALFRGWLLSSFRGRVPGWAAVLVTAALFGLFHLSLYRFLGTFSLGLLMGYMVYRSGSIWPAVVFHFLNNAVALNVADLMGLAGLDPDAGVPIWLVAASVAVGAAGLGLMHLAPPIWKQDQGDPPDPEPAETEPDDPDAPADAP